MSLDNFIKQVWSASILDQLRKSLVYGDVCNRNYEGDISGQGDRVKINQIGAVTVSSYVKNVTSISYQDLEDASLWLTIDQAKYFAFGVDDVDKAQMNVDILTHATDKAAYAMKDTIDQFIAKKYGDAGVTTGLGNDTTPLTITGAATTGGNTGVLELLGLINEKLDMANCPTEGRWIVIPPWLHTKLVIANVLTAETQIGVLTNGRVGKNLGFDIRMSNNVQYGASGTTTAKSKVLAGTMDAVSFAMQLDKVERVRREASFEDGVRGLTLYGAKVVQADALACATVSYAAG